MTTEEFVTWLTNADDNTKLHFVINWNRIPHTLFNIACKYHDVNDLQGIDWYKIHTDRNIGTWSHGGQIAFNC